MRRLDPHAPGPHRGPAYWLRWIQSSEPLTWGEQSPRPTRVSEPADELGANWESAWIDLGGEG
jgi:hypothetical protein